MSNSVFSSSGDQLVPKNRSEQQILQRLRKELKRGQNILQGGVMLADLVRLELSPDLDIRRAAEQLRRRAERKFGSGPATRKQAASAVDTAFNRAFGIDS